MEEPGSKPLDFIRSTLKDLREFPDEVKVSIGHALRVAQNGDKAPNAKPLKGFGGAGVLEIVVDHKGLTYRAAYTVKFPKEIYALHAFIKKSKSGIETPKKEIDLIEKRLKEAEQKYKAKYGDKKDGKEESK
jgi:phage-related protein